MKVTRVEIQSYRSFPDPVSFDLADGMNVFVGRNNCGKSNLFAALTLALHGEAPFDSRSDSPAHKQWALPKIVLQFHAHANNAPEKTLLRYAQEYEESLGTPAGRTYAAKGQLRLVVEYRNGVRQEFFQAAGRGARRPAATDERLLKLLSQFRKTTRFVLGRSGESLESLLSGPFREILQLVLKEHLQEHLAVAEKNRVEYVEQLQQGLLAPLQDRVGSIVRSLFPEITGVELEPQLPAVEDTLTDMRVALSDGAITDLLRKGTGVRGGVLLALLRYLAEQSKRSVIFAVEEPEAFLHPGAQEDLRDQLEGLAERPDVTLLVTTHSPFLVSRSAHSKVFALSKSPEGRTFLRGSVPGNSTQASAISELFRDPGLADILDEALTVDVSACQGLLVVEGATDYAYLRTAATLTGRLEQLERFRVVVAGGASKSVLKALVLKQRTVQPVFVLMDADAPGREAAKRLEQLLNFSGKRELVSLHGRASVAQLQGVEAEDLWPPALMGRFVEEAGDIVLAERTRIARTDHFRIGLTASGKEQIGDWLQRSASAADCQRWADLLDELGRRLDVVLSSRPVEAGPC